MNKVQSGGCFRFQRFDNHALANSFVCSEKTVGEPEMEYARIFLEKHDLVGLFSLYSQCAVEHLPELLIYLTRYFLTIGVQKFVHSTMNVVSQILADICSIWGFREVSIWHDTFDSEGSLDGANNFCFAVCRRASACPRPLRRE